MKRINYIVLTITLLIILMGVELVIIKSASKYEPLATVVYAKCQIPAKTAITPEMLAEKKISISLAHRQSVSSIKDITGKKAKVDIEEGEMILKSRVGTVDDMEEIAVTDKTRRLYTLELKGDQANGGWLMVDQHVDIIYVPDEKMMQIKNTLKLQQTNTLGENSGQPPLPQNLIPSENMNAEDFDTESKVKKLSDIRVAALIDDKGNLLKNTARSTLPRYVTFEVTAQEVDFLAQAKESGKISLAVIPENKGD